MAFTIFTASVERIPWSHWVLPAIHKRILKHHCPLTNLLCKDGFEWSSDATRAFEALKEAMVEAPVLRLPDFTKEFVVETDASKGGIGAVLMQDGHPISYFSRKLGPKLQASSTYIRELDAIVEAIHKWRQYLLGRCFVICTDHQSLK